LTGIDLGMLEQILEMDIFLLYMYTVIMYNFTNVLFKEGIEERYRLFAQEMKKPDRDVDKGTFHELNFITTFIPVFNVFVLYRTIMLSKPSK
jgi:hypothetical protein